MLVILSAIRKVCCITRSLMKVTITGLCDNLLSSSITLTVDRKKTTEDLG